VTGWARVGGFAVVRRDLTGFQHSGPRGYDIALDTAELRAGVDTTLEFRVLRGGAAFTPETYLGAAGHLVLLREGDLAYLHTHPEHAHEPGEITFEASFPSVGRYRLFLEFADRGRVRLAPFDVEVGV
jgi:hypothetical protein